MDMQTASTTLNTALPWLCFALLAVVGVWLFVVNGHWWQTVVPKDYMPNPVLYYVISAVFLLAFPFIYMTSLAACTSNAHRAGTHILFVSITLFLLLWISYLYHKRDVRMALIFLGVATLLVLLATIQAFAMQSQGAGLTLMFLIWMTITWFLVSAARIEGMENMFDTIKDKFRDQLKRDVKPQPAE